MSDYKNHVKISCEECGKEYSTKQGMTKHMNTVHQKNMDTLPPLPLPNNEELGGNEMNHDKDSLDEENEVIDEAADEWDLIEAIKQMSEDLNVDQEKKELYEKIVRLKKVLEKKNDIRNDLKENLDIEKDKNSKLEAFCRI